jgi:hypothetical protein
MQDVKQDVNLESQDGVSRRQMVSQAGTLGFGVLLGGLIAGCGGGNGTSAIAQANQDSTIINAAATAEALASVMYDNIIKSPLYTQGLAGNAPDQAYLVAAREQEAIHYQTLVAAGAKPLAQTFYFPTGMFTNQGSYQTTINTLITLEDTFIAAYLIGVSTLSTSALKVLAAQILGIESEHRTLGRVIAHDLGLSSTTGQSGVAESVNPPVSATNNIAFERTFSSKFKSITDIVTALGPFVTAPTAGAANAFASTAYPFNTTANYYLTTTPTVTLDNSGTTS